MLSTAWHVLDQEQAEKWNSEGKIFKSSFKHHRCSKWCRLSKENYLWLASAGFELCKEYTARYGKTHAREHTLKHLLLHVPNDFEHKGFTMPPQAMPEEYKCEDSITAYRAYYMGEKRYFAVWPAGKKPKWFI